MGSIGIVHGPNISLFKTLISFAGFRFRYIAMQGLGHSFSGYASVVFLTETSLGGLQEKHGLQADKDAELQRENSRRQMIQRWEAHEQDLQGLGYRYAHWIRSFFLVFTRDRARWDSNYSTLA